MTEFSGLDWLRISIANAYGLDGLLFEDRIQWVHDHETTLEQEQAKEQYLYTKAVKAYRDSQNGIPTGYTMGLDSTASGIALMSIVSGCPIGARNTNLIDTGERRDIYTVLVQEMNKLLPAGNQITLTKGGEGITRDMCKQALMVTMFGSTAKPKEIFGEGVELQAFYKVLPIICPGAISVLDDLLSCWNPETLRHSWDIYGNHVNVPVEESVAKSIEVDGFGKFTYVAKVNQPVERGLSLAANVIHNLDSIIVSECTMRCAEDGFDMYSIHDNFICSPIHMNKLRKHYQDVIIEMTEDNIMESICSQLLGKDIKYKKDTEDLSKYLKTGEYFLS